MKQKECYKLYQVLYKYNFSVCASWSLVLQFCLLPSQSLVHSRLYDLWARTTGLPMCCCRKVRLNSLCYWKCTIRWTLIINTQGQTLHLQTNIQSIHLWWFPQQRKLSLQWATKFSHLHLCLIFNLTDWRKVCDFCIQKCVLKCMNVGFMFL